MMPLLDLEVAGQRRGLHYLVLEVEGRSDVRLEAPTKDVSSLARSLVGQQNASDQLIAAIAIAMDHDLDRALTDLISLELGGDICGHDRFRLDRIQRLFDGRRGGRQSGGSRRR